MSRRLQPRLDPKTFARARRRAASRPEQELWNALRDRRFLHLKFRREVPIEGYVADFACIALKLVIEVDGPSHEHRRDYDAKRDDELARHGFLVLRFTVEDVQERLDEVLSRIETEVGRTPR